MRLWAVGPSVLRGVDGTTYYIHDKPALHQVFIEDVGGLGEMNAGRFLVQTPCGYTGWVDGLNTNCEERPACEACLNKAPSTTGHHPIPEGATVADLQRHLEYLDGWSDFTT